MSDTRVAVVTGASRGIGLAIAEKLAGEGMDLALVSRGAEALEEAAAGLAARTGVRTLAVAADLGREEDLLALPERIESSLGPAWMLVNNAGMAASAPLHRSSDDLWDRTMRLNLRAPFLLTRLFGRGMASRGSGRIVNLASTASEKGYPYTAAYTAS